MKFAVFHAATSGQQQHCGPAVEHSAMLHMYSFIYTYMSYVYITHTLLHPWPAPRLLNTTCDADTTVAPVDVRRLTQILVDLQSTTLVDHEDGAWELMRASADENRVNGLWVMVYTAQPQQGNCRL